MLVGYTTLDHAYFFACFIKLFVFENKTKQISSRNLRTLGGIFDAAFRIKLAEASVLVSRGWFVSSIARAVKMIWKIKLCGLLVVFRYGIAQNE